MSTATEQLEFEIRVLLLSPTRRDGELTAEFLARAGVPCFACQDLDDLAVQIRRGGGTVLLTDEAVNSPFIAGVVLALEQQPPWSDIPIVMLMRGRGTTDAAAAALRA